ncbi:hypothetical protein B0J18DRAFT_411290 [Chaetomium sp. MPI-SDFR-AT-0129]|nr:hypothetical protein B0J18DRAFT_411290 [Chaetomium sp. MPI-SDFR-AT-0129]
MASRFYGPINPAMLGAEWEGDKEPEQRATRVTPRGGEGRQTQPQRGLAQRLPQSQPQPAAPELPNITSTVAGFWGFNAAMLEGFEDDDDSEASGRTADGGSNPVQELINAIPPAARSLFRDLMPPPLSPTPSVREFSNDDRRNGRERHDRGREGEYKLETQQQRTNKVPPSREVSTARSESSRSTNPYAAAIDNKQNALTVAYLRSTAKDGPVDSPNPPAPDELGCTPNPYSRFGQRYKVADQTSSVVITNQRRLPDVLSGDRECIVCTDTKPVSEFPAAGITKACDHDPTTCLVCVEMSIKSDLTSKLWDEIKCPECRATLEYDDVQRFADEETKERYQTLSFRSAISSSPTFLWCTSGCGYGQEHESGAASPIVTCRLCSHRSCFNHRVAWHENLTCEEYDALQADPTNFRSRFDLDNEEAEEAAAARRAQEDADRVFAQSLVAADQAEERAERERRARREEEEARERAAREQREAREREMRKAAARKKREEEASSRTVGTTTKPCPGCQAPIEKNQGW